MQGCVVVTAEGFIREVEAGEVCQYTLMPTTVDLTVTGADIGYAITSGFSAVMVVSFLGAYGFGVAKNMIRMVR